jgi:hypothetical protein
MRKHVLIDVQVTLHLFSSNVPMLALSNRPKLDLSVNVLFVSIA